MMNLEEIFKFVKWQEGKGILLQGERRRVRLEVNTQGPAQFFIRQGGEDPRFLATVEGRETITFMADGPVTILPDAEGEVWWWCSEIESSSVEIPDAKTFTRPWERKPRDLNVERMMAAMRANAERFQSDLLAQVGGLVTEQRAEIEALKKEKKRGKRPAASSASASGDGGKQPDPAGDGDAPEGDEGGGGDGNE